MGYDSMPPTGEIKPCIKCGARDRYAPRKPGRRVGACRPCAIALGGSPEALAKMRARAKAYRDTPEGKAALAAYHQTPARKEKNREKAKRRAKTPEAAAYRKAFRLKSNFGLTIEAYRQMIADQRNKCAVCGDEMTPGPGTCVDHDHDTGQVRGLLCTCCNVAEGMLKGSVLRCEKMIVYLKRHAPKLTFAT